MAVAARAVLTCGADFAACVREIRAQVGPALTLALTLTLTLTLTL